MSAEIFEEVRRFGQVLLTGILLAGSYDILRIIRAVFVHARWLEDGEDILFWIIWFVYLVDTLYYGSYGTIRGFVILAFLIGIGLYENLFSHFIVSFVTTKIVYKIFHLCKKLTKNKKNNTIKIGRKSGRRGYGYENKKKGCIPEEKATK